MKRYKSKYLGAALLAAVCTLSCTGDYQYMNTNPFDATKDDMNKDGYIVNALITTLQSNVLPLQVHTFQFVDCLCGGPFGGYISDSGSWPYRISLFNPTDDWTKPAFNTIIPNIFSNYNKLTAATDDAVILSVAKVIKVAAMQRVTDIYGPIPYSKVGIDGQLTSPYDSQEVVYKTMLSELNEAIAVLNDNRASTFTPKGDKVFNGSVEKWVRFANSLKLRLAMRISYALPDVAKTAAEEAAKDAMTSNDDNALMKLSENPFRVVMYDYNGGESRISADIASYMNGYQDPRRAKYFTKTSATENDGFNGLRSGVPNHAWNNSSLYYSNMGVEISSPLMWMNAAEVSFLKAEGAIRGWSMGGDAETLYNKGIELSFAQWQAGDASAYIANDQLEPAAYTDPTGRYNGTKQSSVTIAWVESDDFETKLERIITQKWIANFPLGNESWAEFRRTGYPKLLASPSATGMGLAVGMQPKRLPYPQDEFISNKTNYLNAVTLLGGNDNMATPLWWDCKPNN